MRIGFFVSEFPKLSETFVINQLMGLIDAGHDPRIFTGAWGELQRMHQDVIDYDLLTRTRCRSAMPRLRPARLIKGAILLLAAAGRTPRRLARFLARNTGYGRAERVYDASMMWGREFDVIHAQFGPEGLRALRLRDAGVISGRLITHFRGYDISTFVRSHGRDVYKPLFERGDFFLVNCEFFHRRLLELGCPADRLRVHRSGIDVEAFSFRARLGPADNTVRLLTVGRLTGKKGIEYALEACSALVSRKWKLHYDVIGDGELRPALENLIAELGLGESVRLLGGGTQQQIRDALDAADIFVAPSVTGPDGDQDAPVNVLKEAMAAGLPVIATTHGGIPELVEDGVSGVLVPERSAPDLARGLEELMQRPQSWEAMGRAGRERVLRDYDLHVLNQRLIAIYESVVEGQSPAAVADGEALEPATHETSAEFAVPV